MGLHDSQVNKAERRYGQGEDTLGQSPRRIAAGSIRLMNKRLIWNRLSLDIPTPWETIVKGPRHLIFEHGLAPVLEIRWQPPAKPGKVSERVQRKHTETIIRQCNIPASSSRAQTADHRLPAAVLEQFDTTVFDAQPGSPASLLLVCKACSTTILAALHRATPAWFATHASVFESLCCRHDDAAFTPWQIQDFFFAVPAGFELDTCSFTFGISDLLFRSRRADLRICRLAPASEHLKRSSLPALFAAFCSAAPESVEIVDEQTLGYHSAPSLVEQLWKRACRKRPFIQASFNHFVEYDRILGSLLAANQVPPPEFTTPIANGYGIIQEKTAAADPHP